MSEGLSREEVAKIVEDTYKENFTSSELKKKIASIPALLKKYEGNWEKMLEGLEKKYGNKIKNSTKKEKDQSPSKVTPKAKNAQDARAAREAASKEIANNKAKEKLQREKLALEKAVESAKDKAEGAVKSKADAEARWEKQKSEQEKMKKDIEDLKKLKGDLTNKANQSKKDQVAAERSLQISKKSGQKERAILDKLKKQTEMRVNFDVIANVPLYKNINQKDYSIVKLKKEDI